MTVRIQRILFATDFLESSRLALDYAVAMAHRFNATLVMLHVVELSGAAYEVEAANHLPSVTRTYAQEHLDAFASSVRRTGVSVRTWVADGNPTDVILSAVQTLPADLLVLGVHGIHRGLSHLIVGSNLEKLVLSSSCPTLSVGAHVRGGIDLDLRLKRVLYVSDFTADSAAAAPVAHFLAISFDAPVNTCYLLPKAASHDRQLRENLLDQQRKQMQQLDPDAKPASQKQTVELQEGTQIHQILTLAAAEPGAIIVLGVHTKSFLGRHLQTSLAYELLANAPCPVVTVRSQPAL